MPFDRWIAIVLLRLRALVRGRQLDRDLDDELRDHLERQTTANIARGMAPDEARRAALAALGGLQQEREICRDARGLRWLQDLRQDLPYGLRQLRRNPGFSIVAGVTLALGIGATAAMFSVVRAVLLEPLPYDHPESLVRLYERVPAGGASNGTTLRWVSVHLRELAELRRTRALSVVSALDFSVVTMIRGGDGVQMFGAPISPGTLQMLGVQPALGRGFVEEDASPGADNVLVLSYGVWQRQFHGDPGVLGRDVRLAGDSDFVSGLALDAPYTVIGVMPRGFFFPDERTQFWTPLARSTGDARVGVVARLADGVSPDAATSEMGAMLARLRRTAAAKASAPPHFELVPLEDQAAARVEPALLALMGGVGFVLLLACANVANLLLARSAARQGEMAVRIAIGAGRARLMRQALTESVLLAGIGGIAGAALAFGGVRGFRLLATNLIRFDLGSSAIFPRLDAIGIDLPLFGFAVLLSLATGVLFGLAPALSHLRISQIEVLRGANTPGSGFRLRGPSAQGILVVVQIATAMLLFVGGTLLIRSFANLASIDPGYDPSGVLTFQVSVPGAGSSELRVARLAGELEARLQSLPGVKAAAYARQLPMVMLKDSFPVRTTSAGDSSSAARIVPDGRFVSWQYLDVMGIHLVAGRALRETDRAGQRRVMVINRTLARRLFGGGNPVGRHVYAGGDASPWEVVGVGEDVHQFGLDQEPQPQFFVEIGQWRGRSRFPSGVYFVLRAVGAPASVLPDVRSIVRQVDSQARLYNVAAMDRIVSSSMTLPRMYAVLAGLFAVIAIVLAAIGIYGVMAYAVAQRTREIGIRMALGAGRARVGGLVLRQSLTLTALGLVLGVAAATMTTRFLESLLFGLAPLDPATFVMAAFGFATVAVCASIVPARRATAVDPVVALRAE